MILLVALVVVAVAVAALVLGGTSLFATRRQSGPRSGSTVASLALAAVAVVGVAVVASVVVGLGGAGPGGSPAPVNGAETRATAAQPAPDAGPASTLPRARVGSPGADLRVVVVEAVQDDGRQLEAPRPVGGLEPGEVVRVLAMGFEPFERGRIEHCVVELGAETACAGAFPVQLDENGRADLQFSVRAGVAPGGCRAGEATCLLRVSGDASGRRGSSQVVLVDDAPAGRVTLTPTRAQAGGQRVEVAVSGFPGGVRAAAVLCAPPGAYDARRCSAPSPSSTFTTDATGGGTTTLAVAPGPVGPGGARCGTRQPCAVVVVVGPGYLAAPAATVSFSAGPVVDYDGGRLLVGVAVAALLVGLGLAMALTTDWAEPAEAATPELDRADLETDPTLDEIFGTDEEIDARDPIPR